MTEKEKKELADEEIQEGEEEIDEDYDIDWEV